MKILIAEDEPVSRLVLQTNLTKWGHEVVITTDGLEAFNALNSDDAPSLAVLDWMMPHLDGVEVCRKIRAGRPGQTFYLILLTAKGTKEDIVEGFAAGADDYVTKPFNSAELQARINAGVRIIELQSTLAARVKELEDAMSIIQSLQADLDLLVPTPPPSII